MTIDEMIAVLQAAKAGKQIQRERDMGATCWYDIDIKDWASFLTPMRVKPEPREWLVSEGDLQRAYSRQDFDEENRYMMRRIREVLE